MKLHWSPKSPFVRKVMVAAHELGLVDRIDTIRSVAAMGKPNLAIMSDNPLSKIPTLVLDDGEPIYDSVVICEYLDDLAGGGRLFPRAGRARWTALTWHALGQGLTDLLVLWRNEREKPAGEQSAAWLAAFPVKAAASLDRLEAMAPDLNAGTFNIGHIAIGCALSYADFRFADLAWRDTRPALAAWHAGYAARPSAVATEVTDG
ncbi:MAG: glutathione S-transferase [Sphingopyxis macrogoltabida]|uniref:Glutathione S-transferase n=1 Tax=Sphingopyxis macrogoltabida TaxID=33050 RepID=A0A2W5N351_SPHMC|nr:MAG: glutathione S-transferase [Sphingopyxis macrogoltabida]